MIHTNPSPNIVTSRTLSGPPLQTFPNNPLQYNLSNTNTHNTQYSIYSLEQNAQINPSNISVQHHNVPMPSSSSIRTNPYFPPRSQNPTNTNNLQTHTSHSNYHKTHPYAQPTTPGSHPTYIKSFTSISEPMNITFGTLDEWLLYNDLLLVQLSAGTFAYMTLTIKTGLLFYKLLRNYFCLKRMLTMHKLKL